MLLEKIKLDCECDDLPLMLLTSQWQRSERSICYVWYRWIVAIFFSFSFINSVIFSILKNETAFMFIYLSRWNLFGSMVVTLLGAGLVTCHHFDRLKVNRYRSVLKFYWLLSNNSVVFACMISSIYWTMLYREQHNNLNNVLVHATNSIVLIVDLFVSRQPHRMAHFIYPMACGSLYMFFTLLYPLAGGVDGAGNNFVYPILDWKASPRTSIIVGAGSVISLGITHVIVGVLHRIRSKIHQCVTPQAIAASDQILPFVNKQERK